MGLSRIFRYFLLALLPVIGLIVYLTGRNHDPDLISFKEPQSPGDDIVMESFLPDRIAGLNRTGAVRSYAKDTLYEVIDGHAEYFISAGFNRLVVGEYNDPNASSGGPGLVIHIYDMIKSIQAFGVLSDESGGQARGGSYEVSSTEGLHGVNFSCGRYYVQVMAYDRGIPVDEIRDEIRLKMGVQDDTIPELTRFPDLGEVARTRYVRESYRGISFFSNVLEREYGSGPGKFNVSMSLGNEDEIKKSTDLFIKYFKESGLDYTSANLNGSQVYRIKDPYEGDWVLIPMSDSIFGLYGSFDDDTMAKIIRGKKK